MKVGDLVRLKMIHEGQKPARVGVVVDIIQKKCWRTQEMGTKINWDAIGPELHGVVLYDDCTMSLPVKDLEIITE